MELAAILHVALKYLLHFPAAELDSVTKVEAAECFSRALRHAALPRDDDSDWSPCRLKVIPPCAAMIDRGS